MTYQEALVWCSQGYQNACTIALQYELEAHKQIHPAYQGWDIGSGSPADNWVGPEELYQGGVRGVRPGPMSTIDFLR
jgi:hypothetical protein